MNYFDLKVKFDSVGNIINNILCNKCGKTCAKSEVTDLRKQPLLGPIY
jgi:hypothetical protein